MPSTIVPRLDTEGLLVTWEAAVWELDDPSQQYVVRGSIVRGPGIAFDVQPTFEPVEGAITIALYDAVSRQPVLATWPHMDESSASYSMNVRRGTISPVTVGVEWAERPIRIVARRLNAGDYDPVIVVETTLRLPRAGEVIEVPLIVHGQEKQRASLQVQVFDDSGLPIAGATVQTLARARGLDASDYQGHVAVTDEQGIARLRLEAPEPDEPVDQSIRVRAEGFESRTEIASMSREGDNTLRVVLARANSEIVGLVLDTLGNPILGSAVEMRPPTGKDANLAMHEVRRVTTDSSGAYKFVGVPRGRVTVSVSHPDYWFPEDDATWEVLAALRYPLNFHGVALPKLQIVPSEHLEFRIYPIEAIAPPTSLVDALEDVDDLSTLEREYAQSLLVAAYMGVACSVSEFGSESLLSLLPGVYRIQYGGFLDGKRWIDHRVVRLEWGTRSNSIALGLPEQLTPLDVTVAFRLNANSPPVFLPALLVFPGRTTALELVARNDEADWLTMAYRSGGVHHSSIDRAVGEIREDLYRGKVIKRLRSVYATARRNGESIHLSWITNDGQCPLWVGRGVDDLTVWSPCSGCAVTATNKSSAPLICDVSENGVALQIEGTDEAVSPAPSVAALLINTARMSIPQRVWALPNGRFWIPPLPAGEHVVGVASRYRITGSSTSTLTGPRGDLWPLVVIENERAVVRLSVRRK